MEVPEYPEAAAEGEALAHPKLALIWLFRDSVISCGSPHWVEAYGRSILSVGPTSLSLLGVLGWFRGILPQPERDSRVRDRYGASLDWLAHRED